MGWIGTVLIAVGVWKIAYKQRSALALIIAGELCWLIEAACSSQLDLVLAKAIAIALAVRNFHYWGKDDVAAVS